MTEATPEMIAMARRIAAASGPFAVDVALAAIIETQRRDADVADGWLQSDFDESANCMAQNIRDEIRAGHHYGKDSQ